MNAHGRRFFLWFLIATFTTSSLTLALQNESSPYSTLFRKLTLSSLLYWKKMRDEILDIGNLNETYKENPPFNGICSPETLTARTADGSCNNIENPSMGAAGLRFGRNVKVEDTFPESPDTIMSPGPRELSRIFLTRKEFKPIPFANLLVASWIQFMVHDWFSHGDNEPIAEDPFVLKLMPDDPFKSAWQQDMLIPRTLKDPTQGQNSVNDAPTRLNENTHWWDGSQIYGSDPKTLDSLRSHTDGKLSVEDGHIPMLDAYRHPHSPELRDGVEATGFRHNWWVGLSLMHNLFVLEHNSICDMLKSNPKYKNWSDEQLFNTARLINAAVMAKIHTLDWTPTILSNKILARGMNANWYGVFGNDNLVGRPSNLHGHQYNITEEFVSVYRMHSLLPETLKILSNKTGEQIDEVSLKDTRGEKAYQMVTSQKYSMTDLFYSFGNAHPGLLTLNNYPAFLQNLEMPVVGNIDLGTYDILRDRERGVPRYNKFRADIGLKPLTSFKDLEADPEITARLEKIYGNDINKLDLLIGCLAENVRPEGYGFGETTFQIFLLMASRRLEADRFYTDYYKAEKDGKPVYTKEGMDWINHTGMKQVLLRHYPELKDSMKKVENAFHPWDGSAEGK